LNYFSLLVTISSSEPGIVHFLTVYRMHPGEQKRSAKLVMARVSCLVYAYVGAMLPVTRLDVVRVVVPAS